ncbi:MAG: hypothetical protein JF615_11185 [Asticcacaulis sp.]|nr:hypothetical protein [Asticcacaulis sp.]
MSSKILCLKCEVSLRPVVGTQGATLTCPACGAGDTRMNIAREIKAYADDLAARDLEDSVRRLAEKSSRLRLQASPRPPRMCRFVLIEEDLRADG